MVAGAVAAARLEFEARLPLGGGSVAEKGAAAAAAAGGAGVAAAHVRWWQSVRATQSTFCGR